VILDDFAQIERPRYSVFSNNNRGKVLSDSAKKLEVVGNLDFEAPKWGLDIRDAMIP